MSAPALLSAALAYAARGLPVFPLRPRDKPPLIPKSEGGKGCHDATTDAAIIRRWWKREPNANIGLACGPACWALDIDGQEGLDSLADLEDLNRWLPKGPASLTGSGGMHLLFAGNKRVKNTVKRLGPGLDTRAAGGCIVGPPSIHPNGNAYAWLPGREPWTVPLPPAPAWLLDLLDPPKPKTAPAPRLKSTRKPTGDRYLEAAIRNELDRVARAGRGERNSVLFKAAACLGRFTITGQLTAGEIGMALVDAATAAGLPHREAERTTNSGLMTAIRGAA